MTTTASVIPHRPFVASDTPPRARTTRPSIIILSLQLGLTTFTACGGEGSDDGPPAAPEMLEAAVLGDGAHITWVDASDNEREFMIMRMDVTAGGDYEEVATVPFDTTQYHDAPLTPGTTYMFMVMAVNDAGSNDSNEVELMMP